MTIHELLSQTVSTFNAGRCFGPPIERNGVTVIPVAISGGGGGGGDGAPETGIPSNGGGFGGMSWPLGVYMVRGEDVKWVPIIDPTRLAIAAIGLVKIGLKVRAVRRSAS